MPAKRNIIEIDSVKAEQKTSVQKIALAGKTPTAAYSVNEKIKGIWTDGSTENATFEIQKDSIYYVDQFKSYKYLIKDDSIKIYYPDYVYSGKCYFVKDTLVMDNKDNGIAKFWKFKN